MPDGKGAATRALIGDTARTMFTEQGYLNTSVRAIGAAAGVDPALVVRYFGSKEQLFLETVTMTGFIDDALDGPLEGLGERLVAAVFAGDLQVRLSIFGGMLRASGSETIRERIRETAERTFIGPLDRLLTGPDTRLRARLISAQVTGLLTAMILDDMVAEDPEAIIATFGPALQSLI